MLLIESAINRYLALDPEAVEKLARLDGKVIKIVVSGAGASFYVLPRDKGIKVKLVCDAEPDTVLTGSPASLFKMSMNTDVAGLLLSGEVEISGDVGLGREFRNIFNSMDIDWSEPLAQLVGDAVAYQLVERGKQFFSWGRESADSVTTSIGEYLQEESRDVAGEHELESFHRKVDRLRDDVERLQARLDKFKAEKNL